MFRLGLILMSICMIASLVLAATYKMTLPAIERQKTGAQKEALAGILPQADDFIAKKTPSGQVYYEGLKRGSAVGYVLQVKAAGYAGAIDILAGVDAAGIIQGVSVLSHQETPGLGARITEIRPAEKKPWFLAQFEGRPAKAVKMADIQAISGATISSRAVLEGVQKAAEEFFKK